MQHSDDSAYLNALKSGQVMIDTFLEYNKAIKSKYESLDDEVMALHYLRKQFNETVEDFFNKKDKLNFADRMKVTDGILRYKDADEKGWIRDILIYHVAEVNDKRCKLYVDEIRANLKFTERFEVQKKLNSEQDDILKKSKEEPSIELAQTLIDSVLKQIEEVARMSNECVLSKNPKNILEYYGYNIASFNKDNLKYINELALKAFIEIHKINGDKNMSMSNKLNEIGKVLAYSNSDLKNHPFCKAGDRFDECHKNIEKSVALTFTQAGLDVFQSKKKAKTKVKTEVADGKKEELLPPRHPR